MPGMFQGLRLDVWVGAQLLSDTIEQLVVFEKVCDGRVNRFFKLVVVVAVSGDVVFQFFSCAGFDTRSEVLEIGVYCCEAVRIARLL